jgi:hypothetical protein
MLAAFGQSETDRILGNLSQANRPSASLALESYAPVQFRPLGNLNRPCGVVYAASARQCQDGKPD